MSTAASSEELHPFSKKLVWLRHAVWHHLKSHWLTWILFVVCMNLIQANYQIIGNKSDSINGHIFLLHKGTTVSRGDVAIFKWDGWGPYPYPALFGKFVAGVPGDLVTRVGREYFINGKSAGVAKEIGLTGTRLTMNPIPPEGYVLKPGEYFFNTPHPYSLDSRYIIPGFVSSKKILGRADIIF